MFAWTQGANVPDAKLRLQASPSTVTPQFSFGCGSSDGTASCDLGAVNANASQRQFQAQVTLPINAQPVTSVALSVVGIAANVSVDPVATATVAITGLASTLNPIPAASPLPVGPLPNIPPANIPGANPSLSPGGNAGNLFPTLNPSPQSSSNPRQAIARPVANAAALPGGASVIGAQLAGLAALALGFVLALTRLSVRRRPAGQPATAAGGNNGKPDAPANDAPAK